MWSEFGLRSLARNDAYFGTGENYWRGKVWINVNFLVLRALKRTYSVRGAYAERCGDVYRRLRENVIGKVIKQVGENVLFYIV